MEFKYSREEYIKSLEEQYEKTIFEQHFNILANQYMLENGGLSKEERIKLAERMSNDARVYNKTRLYLQFLKLGNKKDMFKALGANDLPEVQTLPLQVFSFVTDEKKLKDYAQTLFRTDRALTTKLYKEEYKKDDALVIVDMHFNEDGDLKMKYKDIAMKTGRSKKEVEEVIEGFFLKLAKLLAKHSKEIYKDYLI